MNDIVACLPSTDSFSDAWPVAMSCLRKYWTDAPFPIRTMSNWIPWGDAPLLVGTDREWTQNLLKALDHLSEEFVLLFLEDMLLCREVYTDDLLEYMTIMRAFPEIGAFRVGQTGGDMPIDPSQDREPFKALRIDPASPYYVSTGPTIWRVPFLRKVLENSGSTAWEFEQKGTVFARTCEEEIWMPRGEEHTRPFRQFYTAIERGKWVGECIEWLKTLGIEVDTSKRQTIWLKDRKTGPEWFPGNH